MSWWDNLTHPINDALNSNVFKGLFPVQALGQEAVKFGSGLTGMNHGNGLNPADQYAIGAGTGGALAGGSALFGGGGGGMTPYMPTSAPNMNAAGSTMGGGMNSPLNMGGPVGGGQMSTAPSASPISRILQGMRGGMPDGGMGQPQQQQQQRPRNSLAQLYQMFPKLRPHLGGHYGA